MSRLTKQQDKEQKLARWTKVMNVIPHLRLRYRVVIFEHHIKIQTKSGASYDYYPKGQRINKRKGGVNSTYRDLSVDEFMRTFLDL
jgi:hypothetical protein